MQGFKDGAHAPVEHGVECHNFVHMHGLHLEQLCHIVHDTDACPSLVLSLAKVKEGDGGCLFVLGWVTRNNFIGTLKVLGQKLEWNLRKMMRQPGNRERMYGHTPGLLYGLSLCCNGVRDQHTHSRTAQGTNHKERIRTPRQRHGKVVCWSS